MRLRNERGGSWLLLIAALAATASAEAPLPPTADEVVALVNARDDGETMVQTLSMRLVDRRGRVREREVRTYRRYEGPDRQSIVVFEAPKNLQGTAFLTWDYREAGRVDDQWLYLPAARKPRRISASARGSYFMGTDLTYEDVKNENRINASDYGFEMLGEAMIGDVRCWRIGASPRDENVANTLGYGRLELLVDAERAVVRRLEAWDVNDNPLKRVDFADVREVDGIWTPHEIRAIHHKTGHRTVLTSREVRYREALDGRLFQSRLMDRIR